MSLTKYDRYKDSGIDWLGEIPSHWSSYRADHIGILVRGNTGLKKDELLEKGEYVALQYGKTYKVDEVNDSFEYFVNSELYKKSQIVNRGDTIIISTSETIEDLGHSCFYNRSDLGLIGGEQILFKPNSKFIAHKYLYYYSKGFCTELRKYATGLKVFRFNINDLKQILVAIPPIKEQQQIANYLDQQTNTIDKKIKLLEAKIEHYQDLRKSLINETVCRGLDKTAALKDSGIEWIGAIPEHWEVIRLGALFDNRSEKVSDKEYSPLSVTMRGIVPQLKTAAKTKNGDNRKKVLRNDFVINSRSDRKGSSGVSNYRGSVSVISIVLKPKVTLEMKYFHYLFRSFSFVEEFYRNGKGIVDDLWSTKYSAMRTIQVPFLPIKEQQQIANYLDEKTGIIDQIIANIQSQVVRLQELRKSLINEVVTGKVRVPEMENVK